MHLSDVFSEELAAVDQRVDGLIRRADAATRRDALPLLREAVAELEATREELRQRRDEAVSATDAVDAQTRHYADLFLHAPDAYVVTDGNGVVSEVNNAAARLLTRAHDDHAGQPLAAFFAPGDAPHIRAAVTALGRGEQPATLGLRVRRRGGINVPVTAVANPIVEHDHTIGTRWLIRADGAAEHASREVDDYELLELLPAPACKFTPDWRLVYANRAWRDYTGIALDDVPGADWHSVVADADAVALSASDERCPPAMRRSECEFGFRRHDGEYRLHRGRFRRIAGAGGELRGWVVVLADIEHERENEDRLRSLYDDARHALDRLRDSIAMKDEFLGLMSHELKGPITTVLGNSEVLIKHGDRIPASARSAALTDIHNDAERLHHIIEDLLSLSRLERSGSVALEPLMVGHLVEAIVTEHRRRYPARQMEIDLASTARPVLGERLYIEQVLRNLLSNAEKYSPAELPIAVRVRAVASEVEVTVADRGPGLSEEEATLVFEPFVRLSRTAAHASGSGIGLTVCKRLIEAQGGRIEARPRDGGGCQFSFAIPVAAELADD
ncbi:MAG TPA: ATP-binding protein [Dehalococcoidia bacterium]|nr:ATP-binding protein [Dehalococcoidia bacterium]